MTDLPVKELLSVTKGEGKLRDRIVASISAVLKGRDVPIALKGLTLIILALLALYSFQFSILVLHILSVAAHLANTPPVNPLVYGCLFGGEMIIGTGLAVQLLPRLNAFGEAARLEDNLNIVADRRNRRGTN